MNAYRRAGRTLLAGVCLATLTACDTRLDPSPRPIDHWPLYGEAGPFDASRPGPGAVRPIDQDFIDFETSWRQFISSAPELVAKVASADQYDEAVDLRR